MKSTFLIADPKSIAEFLGIISITDYELWPLASAKGHKFNSTISWDIKSQEIAIYEFKID